MAFGSQILVDLIDVAVPLVRGSSRRRLSNMSVAAVSPFCMFRSYANQIEGLW